VAPVTLYISICGRKIPRLKLNGEQVHMTFCRSPAAAAPARPTVIAAEAVAPQWLRWRQTGCWRTFDTAA
jgi:hypothetical protein